MALLDEKRDAFVVRIVYDGPPFSGKTTTLRALSSCLARPLETPEEHEGRTLFFDWLDYTAGRFEGRPIRCQVISVPGQRSLAERRRRLLGEADAIVFVADTGGLGIELSTKYARELTGILAGQDLPRPGVIIQANKRDVDDALEMPTVVEAFRKIGIEAAFIETTATDGIGVRETFLFGVRLALDRVRELNRRGLLRSGRPDIDSSDDLLEHLSDGENASQTSLQRRKDGARQCRSARSATAGEAISTAIPIHEALSEAIASEIENQLGPTTAKASTASASRELPDPGVPSGFIWPPVEGRVIVQQALVGQLNEQKRLPSEDFLTHSANGWRIHSRREDLFEDQNTGRSALVNWARLHARNSDVLSERRCVVLSPSADQWRLWQIVGKSRSLQDFLFVDTSSLSNRELAEYLHVAGKKLLAARAAFQRATIEFPFDLDSIGADTPRPSFVGIMPGFDSEGDDRSTQQCPDARESLVLLSRSAPVHRLLGVRDIGRVIEQLEVIGRLTPESKGLAAMLGQILTEERAA